MTSFMIPELAGRNLQVCVSVRFPMLSKFFVTTFYKIK